MRQVIVVLILAILGWQGLRHYQSRTAQAAATGALSAPVSAASVPTFKCDGRTHCSQMTSCEEATFFLRNCPGVKMDGNNDGVPCEKQWCRR